MYFSSFSKKISFVLPKSCYVCATLKIKNVVFINLDLHTHELWLVVFCMNWTWHHLLTTMDKLVSFISKKTRQIVHWLTNSTRTNWLETWGGESEEWRKSCEEFGKETKIKRDWGAGESSELHLGSYNLCHYS